MKDASQQVISGKGFSKHLSIESSIPYEWFIIYVIQTVYCHFLLCPRHPLTLWQFAGCIWTLHLLLLLPHSCWDWWLILSLLFLKNSPSFLMRLLLNKLFSLVCFNKPRDCFPMFTKPADKPVTDLRIVSMLIDDFLSAFLCVDSDISYPLHKLLHHIMYEDFHYQKIF